MAHGCPVLLARNSSLPEVGGDVALYLDDPSPEGIARALEEALSDRPALASRGEAGRARSAGFSWDAAAAGTLAAYREAIA
jgi:glycosyltransferase involved in cell wall biosynthesis